MASSKFSRDEVILALDVLYMAENGRLTADMDSVKELSALLNRLPIHPAENRRACFRSPSGITVQLMHFLSSCKTGRKDPDIGACFYTVAFEFEDRKAELHAVAEAIRKNEKAFSASYGDPCENVSFPEGALLEHLHGLIERRDGQQLAAKERCEVCLSAPAICYRTPKSLLVNHLTVDPTKLLYTKKYTSEHFITVCPTCHAALHQYRPWLTKENCGDVLR